MIAIFKGTKNNEGAEYDLFSVKVPAGSDTWESADWLWWQEYVLQWDGDRDVVTLTLALKGEQRRGQVGPCVWFHVLVPPRGFYVLISVLKKSFCNSKVCKIFFGFLTLQYMPLCNLNNQQLVVIQHVGPGFLGSPYKISALKTFHDSNSSLKSSNHSFLNHSPYQNLWSLCTCMLKYV